MDDTSELAGLWGGNSSKHVLLRTFDTLSVSSSATIWRRMGAVTCHKATCTAGRPCHVVTLLRAVATSTAYHYHHLGHKLHASTVAMLRRCSESNVILALAEERTHASGYVMSRLRCRHGSSWSQVSFLYCRNLTVARRLNL
jgi:hypothetical protein